MPPIRQMPPTQSDWKIGTVAITRVLENEFPLPASLLSVGTEPVALIARSPWASPRFVNAEGHIIFALASTCLVSDGLRIVIDPCISLDARRNDPAFPEQAKGYLERLAAAGFAPEDVDCVVGTHIDGIGHATRRDGEAWIPTFPNARYVWTRQEIERVQADAGDEAVSLEPLLDAKLVDTVTAPHDLTSQVRLEATPGHTPGNTTIRIASAGQEAIVVGDHILNPLQLADPDWGGLDMDPPEAARARRALLEDSAARDILVIGPHFGSPGAIRVAIDGEAWRPAGPHGAP